MFPPPTPVLLQHRALFCPFSRWHYVLCLTSCRNLGKASGGTETEKQQRLLCILGGDWALYQLERTPQEAQMSPRGSPCPSREACDSLGTAT